jgi:hypothetical protein
VRRRLLSRRLGWFLLGPAMFGLAAALGTAEPFRLFLAGLLARRAAALRIPQALQAQEP